jgi:hypothetical protein
VARCVFDQAKIDPQSSDRNRDEFFGFLAALEKGFKETGRLKDAADVHYFTEDLKRRDRAFVIRVLDTVFAKWIYGYGVRPWHQVWLALLLIVGFGFAYMGRSALREEQSQPRMLRLRITDIPVDWSGCTERDWNTASESDSPRNRARRYWHRLGFSSYVFTKIGYDGIVAGKNYAAVVVAEWVIGLAVWILFLLNLANRWPLLHRLFTMTA